VPAIDAAAGPKLGLPLVFASNTKELFTEIARPLVHINVYPTLKEHSMIRRWIAPLIIVIVGSLWFASSTCVFACSCVPPQAPQEEAARSDAVFSGKVTQQTPNANLVEGTQSLKVAFEVGQVWKGSVPQQILLATSDSSASCGYTFENGKEYLVYANTVEGQLSVSLCSRTQLLADAQEDVSVLGQSTAPVAVAAEAPSAQSGGASTRQIALIAGLAVVAAAGLFGGWRYMRRA
jgi:hypothetical protein